MQVQKFIIIHSHIHYIIHINYCFGRRGHLKIVPNTIKWERLMVESLANVLFSSICLSK